MVTQKRLKEIFLYEPDTGFFIRKTTGNVAGNVQPSGYRRITIDLKRYRASRLVWLYVEGYFPENEIDHMNRIRDDDRWCNLRHVSRQCNARNSKVGRNNKSGVIGVFWVDDKNKWRSQISTPSKRYSLGHFKSKKGAVLARWKAEVEHGFPNCNTTSSAYQYLQANN